MYELKNAVGKDLENKKTIKINFQIGSLSNVRVYKVRNYPTLKIVKFGYPKAFIS
jgi:hypothetical protein